MSAGEQAGFGVEQVDGDVTSSAFGLVTANVIGSPVGVHNHHSRQPLLRSLTAYDH